MIKKNKYKKDEVEINKYYKVIVTRDFVYKILGEAESTFVFTGIKPSFWLTFFTPWEIIRDQMWLPIIYAIFFMFLPFIIPAFFILIVIVYDLYAKYRVNERLKELLEEYPDYTFNQYKSIEDNIQGKDAPFLQRLFEFYEKNSNTIIILFVIFVIILSYYIWRN